MNSVARRIASGSMSIADNTACSASSLYGGRRSLYGSRTGGAIENSTGELDIFPSGAFPGRIAQQRGRVIGDDERYAVVPVNEPTELTERSFCVQESLRSEGSKSNNHFWLDELE